MQPDIPALDRFFITFATNRALRLATWVSVAALLSFTRNWLLLWLLPLPLIMDCYGIWVLRQIHPLLQERLIQAMTESGQKLSGLDEEDESFSLEESSGRLKRYLLKSLPNTLNLTLVTPLKSYAVVSRHTGTIFPPRWLHPLEFIHESTGQTEIYYADVNFVEHEDELLTLHFSNGKTFELTGNDKATEAMTALMNKLRKHKDGPAIGLNET